MTEPPGRRPRSTRSHRRRRGVRRLLGLLALVVVLFAALFAFEAWRARSSLLDARDQAHRLTGQLAAGDLAAARDTVGTLRQRTAQARGNTTGWLWDAATHVPFVGDDVDAVQTSAATLDSIAQQALPTLMDVASRVQTGKLAPHHGRLPLHRIAKLSPGINQAAEAVQESADALARIDPDELVGPVASPVATLQAQVADASHALDQIATAFRVLPAATGADGPRHYLLLIQNNAEVRSTGGMPGSWAILEAKHGRVTVTRQGTAGELDIDPPAKPPVRPTKTEKALYGSDIGTQLRDANFNPNFPRFAQMAAGLVHQQTGAHLDGVFAIDPVALSYVLQGTGPVQVTPQRQLTAQNAVPLLLNQVYFDLTDNGAQDAFYRNAAQKVFGAVADGQGDELDVVRALVRGVDERRVLGWSSRSRLAKAIDGTALAGALTRDHPESPQVGVFLNDGAASKLEYYLRDSGTTVTDVRCGRDGDGQAQTVHLHTRLHSTVPRGKDLPIFITGPGQYAGKGVMVLDVQLYGPLNGRIESISINGKKQPTIAGGTVDHRQVAFLYVKVRPGQTVTIDTTMVSGPSQRGDVELSTTPGIESAPDPVTVPSACE